MDNLRKLKETLGQKGKDNVPVLTAWCVVKDVDWENKTMTATGVMDGLDYHDVLLGIGSVFLKPVSKSKCLIGLIENNPAAAFLIECETVETVEIKTDKEYSIEVKGDQVLKMDGEKFLFKNKTESLLDLLKDLIQANIVARHMTNTGATIKLTPDSELIYEQLKTRFANLLSET